MRIIEPSATIIEDELATMTIDHAKNKNLLLIESSLAIAREKLTRAVLSGASGVIVVRVPFRKGGVRDITIGEELSVRERQVEG